LASTSGGSTREEKAMKERQFHILMLLMVVSGLLGGCRESERPEATLSQKSAEGAPATGMGVEPRVDYMKELVVLPEGTDGMQVYFILADQYGQQVKASGHVVFKIIHEGSVLYYKECHISQHDFVDTEVGLGDFERPASLYAFPRISYDQLAYIPKDMFGIAQIEVRVIFTERNGKTVKGSGTHFLQQ